MHDEPQNREPGGGGAIFTSNLQFDKDTDFEASFHSIKRRLGVALFKFLSLLVF
jgi:hypothetical protein